MTAPSQYKNFDDAWGLVARMLRSGESSALWALGLAAAGIVLAPVDRLLAGREARKLAAADENTGPMILIVGAPRSGTTLAYQVLADRLDVSVVTNATALFSRSPLAGSALFGVLPKRRQRFRSFYGNSAGLRAPNDGFSIWNRWLGSDRYRAADAITPQNAANMRRFFSAWRQAFGKPLLNKNNRNADCVELLANALPQACFVEVHRDPVAVVASLIKARETVQGDASKGWGLRANDEAVASDDPIEAVAGQLQLVHQRLAEARAVIPADRILRVAYEDLCADPGAFATRVRDAFDGVELRDGADDAPIAPFTVSSSHSFSDSEVARINAIVKGPER